MPVTDTIRIYKDPSSKRVNLGKKSALELEGFYMKPASEEIEKP